MRQIIAMLLLVSLVACGSGGSDGVLTRRQQTATAIALIPPTPTRARPTETPYLSPTPTPTVNIAPITITPVPGPITPTATDAPEPTPTATEALPTNTPAPTKTPVPKVPELASGTLYFQRNGAIWQLNDQGKETEVVANGTDFRASPDGQRLAFVRDGAVVILEGTTEEILAQGAVAPPIWSPDSTALAVVVSDIPASGFTRTCFAGSMIVVLDVVKKSEVALGEGCQPAWDAKSRRIAYITPQIGDDSQGFNTLVLVNRDGKNAWTPASAPLLSNTFPDERRLFYAPFWSADGETLFALAYIGYRTLSDVSTLERIDPTNGGAEPIGVAFDVEPRSVRALPDGSAIVYTVNSPKGTQFVSTMATSGDPQPFDYFGTPIEVLTSPKVVTEFATAPVWINGGGDIAVVYCEQGQMGCQPGERATIRLYNPKNALDATIIKDVDLQSQLDWAK